LDKQERQVADIFGLPHRLYREFKTSSYRWSHLAMASLEVVEKSIAGNWSVEKTAEWLDATPIEAAQCLKRYAMSKEIESQPNPAGRIHQAIASWLSRFDELSKSERQKMAQDLGLQLANQLDWAVEQGLTLAEVAKELEPKDAIEKDDQSFTKDGLQQAKSDPEPPRWGPAWKD
jgi:hypothetical protein